MLNKDELKNYRLLRGVTQEEVARNSDISKSTVMKMESGATDIDKEKHTQYCNGVNKAYREKKNRKLTQAIKTTKKKKENDD